MIYRDVYTFSYVRHGKSKWYRMSPQETIKFAEKYGYFDIYSTVQKYKSKIEEDEESHYAPIFFDIDAEKEIENAIEDVKKIIQYFLNMGVPKDLIRLWFSGQKGFHIIVEPEIFGIEPDQQLTYIFREVANKLLHFLDLKYIDLRVYTIKRMWRIPNSKHAKTGLYKVELLPEELNKGIDYIIEIAKEPRTQDLYGKIDYSMINPDLKNWWDEFKEDWYNLTEAEKLKPRKTISITKGEYPVCISDILTDSIKAKGMRNKTLVALTSYFKDCGYTQSETETMLIEFSKKIPPDLSSSSEKEKICNCKAVIKTVFGDADKYHFSCAYIRSVGTQDNPVKCEYDLCKYVKPEEQEPIEPIEVNLFESSKASLIGLPLKIKAMVSGKSMIPYQIPRHFKIQCNPKDTQTCHSCSLSSKNGIAVIKIQANDPVILELINTTSTQINSILQKSAKIPKRCPANKIEIIDYGNAVDTQLIPRIKLTSENITKRNEYSIRRSIYVGHDIETSQEYELQCYSYPEPKTQYSVLLSVKKTELAMSDFEIKADPKFLLKELEIFKKGDMTIEEKIYDKWRDLESNVTKIYGRYDMNTAIDLVFHSPLSFFFNDEFIYKGWLECMIVGDSGQGKTQCLRRVIDHYQAGTIVSGETARRTGLAYNFQQIGKEWILQWGIIPLCDMRLVVIDEFHELDKNDVRQLTTIRDGITVAEGVRRGTTPSRTRLIFLANPKYALKQYDYKIQSIVGMFLNNEDLRRLDFAMIVQSGEVDISKIIKQRVNIEHKYNSYLCNLLIKWVWSLKPDNIIFTKDATEYILDNVSILTNKFTSEIPLTESGDLRLKLARISASFACIVFNSEDGVNLIVDKEHAEIAVNTLKNFYQKMDYDGYTKQVKKRELDDNIKVIIKEELKRILNGLDPDTKYNVVELFLNNFRIQKSELEMVIGNKDTTKELIRFLYSKNLIQLAKASEIRKNVSFIEIIKELSEETENPDEVF